MERRKIRDLIADEAILEVQDGNHGEKHPTADYVEEGIPFLMARDFQDGQVDLNGACKIRKSLGDSLRIGFARTGDVLLTHKGSIGLVAIVPEVPDYVMLTPQVTYYRTNPTKLLNTYLKYAFQAPFFRDQLSSFSAQSTRPYIGITAQKELQLDVPPVPVQRRIACILSAYDELIENSQQRIRILETMSRSLYREWFVNFRFPGHQKIPHVASPPGDVPKGWQATTLGTQLSALESGKRPKGGIRDVEGGVPSIGAENINGIGRYDFASEKFVSREFFQKMRKGVVRDRDVAIYKDGAYIGKSSYFRDGFPHTECCVNEHVFLLRADGVRLKQNALYLWLQEPDTVQAIRATNANAAQPGINQQSVGGLELVVPDEKTAAHFDRFAEPLLAEIINLAKRIQNLRRTRDLLLPRLLSGQLPFASEIENVPETTT
jgi:type I restriction enzyme, S subunit